MAPGQFTDTSACPPVPSGPRPLFSSRTLFWTLFSSAGPPSVLAPAQQMPVPRVLVAGGAHPPAGFSSGTAELFLSLCSFIHIFKSPCQVYFCFRGVDHSVHPEEGREGKVTVWGLCGEKDQLTWENYTSH